MNETGKEPDTYDIYLIDSTAPFCVPAGTPIDEVPYSSYAELIVAGVHEDKFQAILAVCNQLRGGIMNKIITSDGVRATMALE